MSTRHLQIIFPALLAVFAVAAFVGLDFAKTRSQAEAEKPGFGDYIAQLARRERAAESGTVETVAAMGAVPGADLPADPEPETLVLTADVVSRSAVAPADSWFPKNEGATRVRVEFTCVKGPGGSKTCTASTVDD